VLDIKWIRDNQDAFVKGLENRAFDDPKGLLNRILKLDEQRRGTIQQLQDAQARRNAASKDIGKAKAAKDEGTAKALMDEVAILKTAIQEGEEGERRLDKELHDLLAGIPNMPASDVPIGDEKANKELRKVGTPKKFSFQPKQHFEIGEALGLMDFETAAKLSGARFVVLKGALARLERALSQFMLDLHTTEHGYTEINPPLLVRDDTMFGTAQLPKFRDDQFSTQKAGAEIEGYNEFMEKGLRAPADALFTSYDNQLSRNERWEQLVAMLNEQLPRLREEFDAGQTERSRLWLIPTAEVPLTNLVRDDITDEAKLPIRVTAGTPCFRAEAGAAGKDTRGMIRQHQFSKVELVSITTPEQSAAEHERMTACAETVLKRLELPFRTIVLSTGDMGFAAQKTYDIEVWLPGQGAYREISSCSVCGDFQGRRMNARYRPKNAKDTRFVHTLNGSGVAVGRALIAVLENYQEEDGSVRVPEVLKPYMGDLTKIEVAK
jgi:seryl-tRNA synthetase